MCTNCSLLGLWSVFQIWLVQFVVIKNVGFCSPLHPVQPTNHEEGKNIKNKNKRVKWKKNGDKGFGSDLHLVVFGFYMFPFFLCLLPYAFSTFRWEVHFQAVYEGSLTTNRQFATFCWNNVDWPSWWGNVLMLLSSFINSAVFQLLDWKT